MTEADLKQIEINNIALDDVRAQRAVTELLAEVRRLRAVQADLVAAIAGAIRTVEIYAPKQAARLTAAVRAAAMEG